MRPCDFWSLTPTEFWWLCDASTERSKDTKMYGSLTEREVEQLYKDAYSDGDG